MKLPPLPLPAIPMPTHAARGPVLPPIVRPLPKLPPIAKPLPPLPAVARPNVHGDAVLGYVQIILPTADDAAARTLFISCGVKMAGPGVMPADGVLTAHKQPSGSGYVYRWRC